jgi:hypothetical protein
MFPFVIDGSILFFERPAAVQVGDIVLTEAGGRWLAHRVVCTGHGTITTWGDFNRQPDPAVASDRVLGRCVQVRRKGTDISLDLPCVRVTGWLLAKALPLLKALLPP